MTVTENSHSLLANECRSYLQQENAHLDALTGSLKAMREALLSREMDALDERLQNTITERPQELNDLQSQLRMRLAPLLGRGADEIRLEDVASFAGTAHHEDFDEMIESMRRKRREIGLLSGSNMAVAGALSRMIDRFIQHTTGVPTISTYGPNGEVERTGHGHLENRMEA
ncbi:hypothetical protein ACFL2H_04785 [Planctomycetota bacterium]